MFMLLWQSYQGRKTSIELSDWFIFSSKQQVAHYQGEDFHSYTMFTRRIWLFYNITFIPETSNETHKPDPKKVMPPDKFST